ncbi:MAG: TolC family protein [Reichenbachiella sp.]|uniref:TolC family protein n=2 Tax=Reichenbachiella sp. TaxID=2184521 RepID=UPI003296E6F5
MKILTYIHNNISKLLTVILIIATAYQSLAQAKKPMTIEEVIGKVQQQNWDLKKMNQQVGMASSESKSANSVFLPSVNFTETFTNTTDPMLAFGTKLGQSSIEQADFIPAVLNDPDQISNFSTSINVEQPLFNLDGLYGRKAARKQSEASLYNREWIQKMMVIKAKSLYYQLVLSKRAEQVMMQMKSASAANQEVAQGLFDQGIITLADLLGAQLRLKQVESEWLKAKHQVERSNSELLQQMGETDSYQIDPVDSLPIPLEAQSMLSDSKISQERADLKALKLKAEAAEFGWLSQKGSFAPRINAFGRYTFNDTQFFGTQGNNYLVGVQLKWDIFNGGKQLGATQKARYESQFAQIELEETQSRAHHELHQLKNDFELSIKQIELAGLSADQARELLQIRQDRFGQGMEKTSDLLMAESNYMNQEIQLLKAQHAYLQLMFQLEAAISENLTDENL